MANPLEQPEQLVPDSFGTLRIEERVLLPPGLVVSVMTLAEASWKPDVCTVLCALVSLSSGAF